MTKGVLIALALTFLSARCFAYEADVHFGLTKWLALKAGFEPFEAGLIALGNQRVDSGTMDSIPLTLDYACGHKDAASALKFARLHFPSDATVFAPARDRTVTPDSPAARRAVEERLTLARKGNPSQLLFLFGAALHTHQESWAHAGTPSAVGASLGCDAGFGWGHPATHAADLTVSTPGAIPPMAMATYAYLKAYPILNGRARSAASWDDIAADLDAFARAATKTQKRAWFVAQGVTDTGFLEGTTLPDGPDPGPLRFTGRSLPDLAVSGSTQWDAPENARVFFDKLIERWLSDEKPEAVVREFAGGVDKAQARELAARLKLWKVQDHGRAASLAHVPAPLTARQLAEVDNLTKAPAAALRAKTVPEAFFPLVAGGKRASALLPYVLRPFANTGTPERVMAIARLKHAPYDAVGWIAERSEQGWVLIEMVSVVDH